MVFSDAGVLTIKGTNAMIDLDENTKDNVPWKGYRNDIKSVVIDNGVTSIGGYNFYNCPNLKSVSISSSVTSISQYAFAGCSGLESITIPGSVSTISPYTFNECSVLATVSLGDGVKTIGSNAFRKCNYLVSFTFPASVTNIQSQAFNQCNNLVSITLNSNPFIGENAFSTSPNVRMYLPAHEGKTGKYWLTFYNPYYNFELPPTDVQIFKAALDGTIMTLTELTTDKIVKKGNPVILKSNSATVPLQITPNSPRNDFTGNDLQGVSSEAGLTASDQCYTFVLNKGFLGVGFYMLQSGKTLGFGKAFLTYSASQAPEFLYFDEDSATSIDNSSQSSGAGGTQFTIDNDAGAIYNLAGQRIQKMQRGINIVNGKKIIK